MTRSVDPLSLDATTTTRCLGRGSDWSVAEYACTAGPNDRPFEERHGLATIAAVIGGTFTYRSDSGVAVLHPGALLLGNHGACFECGHEHGVGDLCVAFHYAPEYFAEVAASVGGGSRYRFTSSMMPALPATLPWLVDIEARLARSDDLEAEEAVVRLMELTVHAASAVPAKRVRVSARDSRRIIAAVRHIEEHATDAMSLAELARIAGMSKYHFLRTFRRAVGMTPYQLLLATRLRRAAVALQISNESIALVALDAGFADLSTFNHRFRAHFGDSPTQYRRRARG